MARPGFAQCRTYLNPYPRDLSQDMSLGTYPETGLMRPIPLPIPVTYPETCPRDLSLGTHEGNAVTHLPAPHTPNPRRTSPAVIVGIIVAGLVILCGGLAIIGAVTSKVEPTKAVDSKGIGSPAPYTTASNQAPAPTAATTTTTAPAPAGPKTTIEEGDWVVGTDVAAGQYRTTVAVEGMCYWGIYKAGTNKGDIVQNDIVTGGRPSVTLKAGQEFSSTGCGSWTKVA